MNLANSKKTPLTFDSIEPESGLREALSKSRADIIGEISASKLKGRGGAGFPTGTKWNLAAAAKVKGEGKKYIVCNADESEPGTFKDRLLMERSPHQLIEGLIVAAYAIEADVAYIFLRHEYRDAAA